MLVIARMLVIPRMLVIARHVCSIPSCICLLDYAVSSPVAAAFVVFLAAFTRIKQKLTQLQRYSWEFNNKLTMTIFA